MSQRRVLIVGGVAGGASCAARLRRLDESAEIVIFERSSTVSFANCGLPYYIGGVISDRNQLLVAAPQRFSAIFNIDVRIRCKVTAVRPSEKTIEVVNLETGITTVERYDYLVLSPGAKPIRPDWPGIDLPNVFSLRNMEDMDSICAKLQTESSRRAVVIGAGFIGLETAENLARRGLVVTILEKQSQAMPTMDPEMVVAIAAEAQKNQINLRLAVEVTEIEKTSDGLAVATADGDKIPADLVIVAIGVRPDVALAGKAGIKLGSMGGIVVDEKMRTSDPNIFAVGDVVEVVDFVTQRPALIPLAGPANRQGRLAADAICGREVHYRGSQGTSIVGFFEQTLAMTGATEKSLIRAGIPFEKVYTHSANHAGYYPGAERITLKLIFSPEDGRVLGAQAFGKSGVDKRIDVIAVSIQHGATVYDLEEAELCYAPQFGSAKDATNIAGFVSGNAMRGDMPVGSWSEWFELTEKGSQPFTLDVRPSAMVAAAAIKGTTRIPMAELRSRLNELPRDREIWVHCLVGQTSYLAVRVLLQNGFRARNLSGGFTTYEAELATRKR